MIQTSGASFLFARKLQYGIHTLSARSAYGCEIMGQGPTKGSKMTNQNQECEILIRTKPGIPHEQMADAQRKAEKVIESLGEYGQFLDLVRIVLQKKKGEGISWTWSFRFSVDSDTFFEFKGTSPFAERANKEKVEGYELTVPEVLAYFDSWKLAQQAERALRAYYAKISRKKAAVVKHIPDLDFFEAREVDSVGPDKTYLLKPTARMTALEVFEQVNACGYAMAKQHAFDCVCRGKTWADYGLVLIHDQSLDEAQELSQVKVSMRVKGENVGDYILHANQSWTNQVGENAWILVTS